MKFSYSNKKKEVVNIKIPEMASSVSVAKDEEIYFERVKESDKTTKRDKMFNGLSDKEKIFSSIDAFDKKYQSLLHDYYFLKLFSLAAVKDKKYNETTLVLNKHINRLRRTYDELLKRNNVLKYIETIPGLELEDHYTKINEIFAFVNDLKNDLTEYQTAYYRKLKMASLSLFSDKSSVEIESTTKIVNKMIQEYRNIEEAYDYYYYNSGELIINTINALVNSIKNSGNKNYIETYKFNYFLESDFVMILRYSEWIELFTKILYVKRNVNNIELFDYLSFKNYYEELERRYIVMLIYNEMMQK